MKHFYRCKDCLTVATTTEEIKATYDRNVMRIGHCGACGGWIEYLGKVERNRLIHTEHLCPCDGRCTNATGPSCDCQCGGENHGSGKLVAVDKSGPLPKFMIQVDAKSKAEAYIALCDKYKSAWEAKYGEIVERKRNGEYIRNFDFYLEAIDEWHVFNKVRSMKTHAGRNKRLNELISGLSRALAGSAA
jgi:hypothetical protein